MSDCFLLMHSHSFERICTKFGMLHRYTLQMVMGASERRSSLWAARPGIRNYRAAGATDRAP